ncbi:MAG: hypothetical protein NT005_00295 [Spirochaetes bacterium]|nr:hypothetical protein [Spirochaetota bacterium]
MRTRAELLRALERDGIASVVRESGAAWMIVAPALGARILGAGIGAENALWTAQSFSTRGWRDGGNAGGARTWIAPEGGPHSFFFSANGTRYDVPRELDPGDYQPAPADEGWIAFRNACTARAADGAVFSLAITRSMRIEERQLAQAPERTPAVRALFRHEIENTGSAPIDRRLGLWFIAQVPSEKTGTILIPLREGAPAGSVHPYFGELPPGVLRVSGHMALLKALGGQKYKIGVSAQAAAGGIAFVRPSRTGTDWILVSLGFAVDRSGGYLDRPSHGPEAESSGGDAVQAYNDPGTDHLAFSEIEAHAPAATLGPGERQSFQIEMTIAARPEREIMEYFQRDVAPGVTPSDLSW